MRGWKKWPEHVLGDVLYRLLPKRLAKKKREQFLAPASALRMLDSVRTYVHDRRWRLTKAAGVAGGVYLCGRYVLDRLKDAREAVMQEKQARDQ